MSIFSIRRRLNGLAGDRRGAAALEFAIVAPVFLTVMVSSFEVGWFYFVNSSVDAATIDIARKIRTGQIQGDENFDIEEFFEDEVCPKLQYFGECEERLTAEVQVFDSFQELADDSSDVTCRNDPDEQIDDITVDPGQASEIVRIRLCLLYDSLNPAIGVNLADDEGRRRITSTYIIRNEPFPGADRDGEEGDEG